jgi:RNA polymerase sigma factor (sigma-70 family)
MDQQAGKEFLDVLVEKHLSHCVEPKTNESLLLHLHGENTLRPSGTRGLESPRNDQQLASRESPVSTGGDAGFPTHGASLHELIVRHLPALRSRARHLCRGQCDSEDVVQDAVVRALQAKQPLRDLRRARAWLLAILHSTFVDMLRLRRRRAELTLEIEPPEAITVEESTRPVPWDNIGQDDLCAAIARLSGDLQATYRMFAFEGRSCAEIAAIMRIPRSTVGTRLHRCRKQLRCLLATHS